jgi:hypothetical protein
MLAHYRAVFWVGSRIGEQVVRARVPGRVPALAAESVPARALGFVVVQTRGRSPPP